MGLAILALMLSILALVFSILAYQKSGGMEDLKKQVASLTTVTDTLREKLADTLDRLEKALRKKVEEAEAQPETKVVQPQEQSLQKEEAEKPSAETP